MRDQKLRPTADGLEREKSPAPSGIQTHDLSVMRCALYRCETTNRCQESERFRNSVVGSKFAAPT